MKIKNILYNSIFLHVFFWICYYLFYSFTFSFSFPVSDLGWKPIFIIQSFQTIVTIIVFYASRMILYQTFIKNKISLYIFIVFFPVIFILFYVIVDYIAIIIYYENFIEYRRLLFINDNEMVDFGNKSHFKRFLDSFHFGIIYQIFTSFNVPFIILIMRMYFSVERSKSRIAQEKLQLEIQLLSSQINPHFIFNSLNNIYSLIYNQKRDLALETIIKFSELLRFILYESKKDFIPLQKEIEIINNFIALQKMQRGKVLVDFQTSNILNTRIPTLIFFPLIENAFKYLNYDSNTCRVKIQIRCEKENIVFSVENTYNHYPIKNESGIGINNVYSRLKQYYKNNYTMNITKMEDTFTVDIAFPFLTEI